jgi:hypothetical protein
MIWRLFSLSVAPVSFPATNSNNFFTALYNTSFNGVRHLLRMSAPGW